MKKLIPFLFTIVLCDNALSQTHKVFCQIVGTQKFAKDQVTVAIDFGQEGAMRRNALGGSALKNRLVDESGKPISFNSMVDAMNYMGQLGWVFEQAYVVTMPSAMGGGQNVYHWLLSRDVESDQVATEGFKTQEQHKKEQSQAPQNPKKGPKRPKKSQPEWPADDLYY